jgi:hypothetical protein
MPFLAIIVLVWLALGTLYLWKRAGWPVMIAHYLGPVICTAIWLAVLWDEDAIYLSVWDENLSLLLRFLVVGCLASSIGGMLAAMIIWLDRQPTRHG